MGPVQTAWMDPAKIEVSPEVSKNRQSRIYELNFIPDGVSRPYHAFLKEYGPRFNQSIIFTEVWNLWRVGRLLGSAVDERNGNHFIVMKKEGYFFDEPPCIQLQEKTKKKLIRRARWEYIKKHRMYIG
jgi:hypothetical protein